MRELNKVNGSVKRYTIEEFLGTTNYTGLSFSPAGDKLLVSSDESGIFNVYAIPTDGAPAVQLTASSENAVYAVSYFPKDERFLYTSDQGGNELNHLYVQELDGTNRDLTPGDGLKAVFYGWSDDDGSFFVGSNERHGRYFDVYQVDAQTYDRVMIYQNDEGRDFVAISRRLRYLVFSRVNTNADTDLYLHDRETGTTRLLIDDEGDVNNHAQAFSMDDAYLYYTTDHDSEFTYLVRYRLADGRLEDVVKLDWDITDARLSKQGKFLIVSSNADARTELNFYEAATMTPLVLPTIPDADVTDVRFSNDETRIAFYASSSRMPGELFVADLDGSAPRRLTNSLNPNIDPSDLVDGQVVRFDSYDEIEIPGILYRPHGANSDRKTPALVWVHGGPGGQSRVGYNALIQYLVNHGYAIYAINNRGSSGYGKTFFHLDDRRHGVDDLDDVVESKKMLVETGFIDEGRIGVTGGSYGGYMTLAALTFRPDVFEVGVDIFGISNWHRTLMNTPPWWESFRAALEAEMGPFDDEQFFKAKSPLFHADQIKKPLMVLQGANDPRVLKVESDEIVAAVEANGVPVEYLVFDDEGHGFAKKENQLRGYRAILGFLDRYLARNPK